MGRQRAVPEGREPRTAVAHAFVGAACARPKLQISTSAHTKIHTRRLGDFPGARTQRVGALAVPTFVERPAHERFARRCHGSCVHMKDSTHGRFKCIDIVAIVRLPMPMESYGRRWEDSRAEVEQWRAAVAAAWLSPTCARSAPAGGGGAGARPAACQRIFRRPGQRQDDTVRWGGETMAR